MADGPRYNIPFKRRKQGKTDYKRRLALLKSRKVRAVVRKSLSGTTVQMVEFTPNGDLVLCGASYTDLRKIGWTHSLKDTSASYLTGLLAAKRAVDAQIGEAVLDIGINEPIRGSKVFATLKGLLDAGVEIPHGEDIFPTEERITGIWRDDKKFAKDFETIRSKIMEAGE